VELVSSTPATILKGVSKEQAEIAKALLEAMGAKVSINQI
jgi:ribosomal protein L7/L12